MVLMNIWMKLQTSYHFRIMSRTLVKKKAGTVAPASQLA
ncbi:hypothetical protein JV46_18330 [Solemya velum gill symbiont]|uniref:Uncharacterized protein n=1 Tax=Solemya velum gill symbiont TaxID=2340 RepID=A0A0B0H611_SOVGS|nr:hypothetical protein JV46_18330 [Solemya velum gill symbiont]